MNRILSKKKVVLGMSGGVDSTASAVILKEKGYDVTGLYFDVLGKNSDSYQAAEKAAEILDIPLIYKDKTSDFKTSVISYFYNEYAAGRTPNPCVVCNKAIKFRVLLDAADEIGAYHIATGHYAHTETDAATGEAFIKRPQNRKKEQSYVLWRLGQEELSRVLFPLNTFESKDEIREILRSKGFPNSEKKDSQEICFVENNDYVSFLTEKMGMRAQKGIFTDTQGNRIGEHSGIINYTIGQRKGFGVTFGKPVYVTGINASENKVVLGSNEELHKTRVFSVNNSFCGTDRYYGKNLKAKIRYAAPLSECTICETESGTIVTEFTVPQRAPAPGQSIVWYDDDRLIGGGFIESAE